VRHRASPSIIKLIISGCVLLSVNHVRKSVSAFFHNPSVSCRHRQMCSTSSGLPQRGHASLSRSLHLAIILPVEQNPEMCLQTQCCLGIGTADKAAPKPSQSMTSGQKGPNQFFFPQ
jgi:hypothetical protein